MANENENKKKNVLFMLSSHGSFDDMEKATKIEMYVTHCNKVAVDIVKKVEDMDGVISNVYIGYDGDGVYNTPPVTFLFLTVLDKLAKAKAKAKPERKNTFEITPIISQVPAYMHNLNDLISKKNKFEKSYQPPEEYKWGTHLEETNFKQTVQLLYIAINNKTKASLEGDIEKVKKRIEIDTSHQYKDILKIKNLDDNTIIKKDSYDDNVMNFSDNKYLILVDMGIATDCISENKGIYPLKKGDTHNKDELYLPKNKINDGRSEPYGGISYEPDADAANDTDSYTLVGSTAGWQKYLNHTDTSFESVYYVPVWLQQIKQYDGSITQQTEQACQNKNKIFKNGDKDITVIKDVKVVESIKNQLEMQGGRRSRKRNNRRSKKRNLRNKRNLRSKRKSLRRKRLSRRK